MPRPQPLVLVVLAVGTVALAVSAPAGAARSSAPIEAIGVENQYADVVGQIGGADVHVGAMVSDPNTDPHNFEASPRIAAAFAAARLIVLNGLGYDDWAGRVMSANPRPERTVIDVQHLLGLPDSTANPHLWYDPGTMPAVARAVAASLSAIRPARASFYQANERAFDASLGPWKAAIASFRTRSPGVAVAVTEPVGNAMLLAAGARIRTPDSLQAAIMNGTDPSPQDVTAQNALFTAHAVKVFVYNRQVTDSLTDSFLDLARKNAIPVVGVYETMPTPGFTYQSWMRAEIDALNAAVTEHRSTETLRVAH